MVTLDDNINQCFVDHQLVFRIDECLKGLEAKYQLGFLDENLRSYGVEQLKISLDDVQNDNEARLVLDHEHSDSDLHSFLCNNHTSMSFISSPYEGML